MITVYNYWLTEQEFEGSLFCKEKCNSRQQPGVENRKLQKRHRAQIIKYVGSPSLLSLLVSTVLEILKSIEFFLEQMLLLQLIWGKLTVCHMQTVREMITSSSHRTFNLWGWKPNYYTSLICIWCNTEISHLYASADIIRNAERAGLLVYLNGDTQILLTAYFGHRW